VPESINNNNIGNGHGDSGRTLVRTPRSEIDKIWPHLTVFQKVLFYVLTFASSLGNEVFFFMFFPYVAWNMDSVVFRRAGMVWCLCMYTGQAAKDYLRWPRPTSPPVVRLETDFQQEFAMPSTHAISATVIPFMLAYTIISRYEVRIIKFLFLFLPGNGHDHLADYNAMTYIVGVHTDPSLFPPKM
jgi:membrane-associated phospholipid phosphatase